MRIPGFEDEYFTGVLTSFNGPQEGWSIWVTMFRARTGWWS